MQTTIESKNPGVPSKLPGRSAEIARLLWFGMIGLGFFLVIHLTPLHLNQLSAGTGEPHSSLLQFYSLTGQETQLLLEAGISPRLYAFYVLGLEIGWMLAFIFPSGLLLLRKPNDHLALFVSFALLLEGIFTTPLMFVTAAYDPVWQMPVSVLGGLGLAGLITLLYLFPDGHFVPGWTRFLAALVFFVGPLMTIWAVRSASRPIHFTFSVMILPLAFFMLSGLIAQVIRYRKVSYLLQRQQTKWVVLSMLLMAMGIFSIILSVLVFQEYIFSGWGRVWFLVLSLPLNAFSVALIPVSITFAVLRYRLWDVDLIIRRTLAYSFLTASLGLVTVTSVLVLQRLIDAFLGGGNSLVTVASTLAVVALLARLRLPIQDFIDRRFYRQKYNAEQVLAAFSQRQRNEVDLEAITSDLINVIRATVQPASASLWLIPTSGVPRNKDLR